MTKPTRLKGPLQRATLIGHRTTYESQVALAFGQAPNDNCTVKQDNVTVAAAIWVAI